MENVLTFPQVFGLLIFAHFLADYPLQGTWIATTKDHTNPHPSGYPWKHSLTAHSVIHGGFVGIITGSIMLAVCEIVCHFYTDYKKSNGNFSINEDQFFHIYHKMWWSFVYIICFT